MGSRKTAAQLACAGLLTVAGNAQAFDYWRFDFGYSMSKTADFGDRDFAADRLMCADAACTTGGKIDDAGHAGVFSGGIGWNLKNDWRFDMTIAYRSGYDLSRAFPDTTTIRAEVTSASVMGSLYKDFHLSWARPYLGAGIGVAQNKVDAMQGTFAGAAFTAPGGSKTSYAYQLMAGIGVPLSNSMTLDVGYRYAGLGDLRTDEGTFGGAFAGTTYQGALGKLQAHEVTIGLRF